MSIEMKSASDNEDKTGLRHATRWWCQAHGVIDCCEAGANAIDATHWWARLEEVSPSSSALTSPFARAGEAEAGGKTTGEAAGINSSRRSPHTHLFTPVSIRWACKSAAVRLLILTVSCKYDDGLAMRPVAPAAVWFYWRRERKSTPLLHMIQFSIYLKDRDFNSVIIFTALICPCYLLQYAFITPHALLHR